MEPMKATKPSMENQNIFDKPLQLFSKSPPTGFYRDGYCRTSAEDKGNHTIAAVVTDEFLDFSANRGNNLREAPAKISGGTKWCLCTHRWQEAVDAFKQGKLGEDGVPKVYLDATDKQALETGASYADLRRFKADAAGKREGHVHYRQDESMAPGKTGGIAKIAH